VGTAGGSWLTGSSTADGLIRSEANLIFGIGNSERMRIDSSGRVGIGTTSPAALLHLVTSSSGECFRAANGSDAARLHFYTANTGSQLQSQNSNLLLNAYDNYSLVLATNNNERARIDTSGRLLVGTSTAPTVSDAQYGLLRTQGNSSSSSGFGLVSIARGEAPTSITSGEEIGYVYFTANDGSAFASIECRADGTAGSGDYPGRLVFSTTADGASSPTERMRIRNDGSILIQQTALSSASDGCYFNAGTPANFHQLLCHSSSTSTLANLYLNRQASDGTLIDFRQADTSEGVISVSGTTVSLVGGHIARWSQLLNNGDPSELLKGTVMSNLDEMCEWGEEDNEQLNKTKVSDVEGDPNVAGVFVATSFSEDGPLDFYLAMTGDMIIRIAEGVTVQRGQLLMSAGDGTAKPQGDGFVQDKTIAKVTSTHVTCTYDDGSYCVPCVLMAC
jgi:hypothetical protein